MGPAGEYDKDSAGLFLIHSMSHMTWAGDVPSLRAMKSSQTPGEQDTRIRTRSWHRQHCMPRQLNSHSCKWCRMEAYKSAGRCDTTPL